MEKKSLEKEKVVALGLALKAVQATEHIRRKGIQAVNKADGTPLTRADLVSQAIILEGLRRYFPEDRVVAEETLKVSERAWLGSEAWGLFESLGLPNAEAQVKEWVNYRGNPKGPRMWMIDPIDGTKGFKKGLCYAIAIGLYFDDRPQFGCMATPTFPAPQGAGTRTKIAYAAAGSGAYWLEPGQEGVQRIHVSDCDRIPDLRMVGSRAHDPNDFCGRLMKTTGIKSLVRMDGQAKYLMLASGQAEVYIRTADPIYGIAFPWDHCAGQAILEEAGGKVTGFSGEAINYEDRESPIKDLKGLVASHGRCHKEILKFIQEML